VAKRIEPIRKGYRVSASLRELQLLLENSTAKSHARRVLQPDGRCQSDIAQLFEDINFAEIEIHTLADGLINEMHIGVKGTMTALFLKGLAQKVRRGLAGAVRAGRNPGGDLYG
jgi:hypothetical protein